MFIKHLYMPLLVLVPLFASSLQAGNPEEMLVTGTHSPQASITSSVSVLDAAQIRALNKRTLVGLLKTMPGLLVEEQGGPGGLTAISIRGGEANFTLVMLDGVPVNDPTNTRGGGFDFANLNAAVVERIEVVRGAESAIYGSDALAGVINIVTRRLEQGQQQTLALEGGEDSYRDYRFSALGREAEFDYTLELSRRDSGDPVPGSERDSDGANLRLGWQVGDDHSVTASYRYLEGDRSSYPEQSGGPELAVIDALDHASYQDQVAGLVWSNQVNALWRSQLSLTRFDHEEDYLSPGIPPFTDVPSNGAETDYTRDQLRWVNSLNLGQGYLLDVGGEYRSEEGESVGFLDFFGSRLATDFELDRDIVGAFVNLAAAPARGVLLNAGLRYDDPDDFDEELTWKLGASFTAGTGIVLSANWGEAFKLPSFFALGHPLVGNSDLLPEEAESWDVGIAWEGGEGQRLALTGFFNDFSNLVDFDENSFRNVNRKQVESSGVEMEVVWPLAEAVSLGLNGTYTDLDVKGEDTVLTGRPEWSAGAIVRWQIARQWDSAVDYRYSGRQWATSRHSGDEQTERLDDYHRVDWVLRWAPGARWQLQLSADNVLDEDIETAIGFYAPGRAWRIGLRLTY